MRSILIKIAAAAAVIAIGFIALLYAYNAILGIGETGDIIVPDLRGRTVEAARATARKSFLSFSVLRSEYSDSVPKGEIINQEPDPGMQVKKGRPIQVVISEGAQQSAVPDLRGLDFRQATLQLENVHLKVGTVKFKSHPVAKKDVVVDQNPPPGQILKADTKVDLLVSSGPPPMLSMPNLVGKDLDGAKGIMKDDKLEMGQIGWRWDDNDTAGTVLTQNPPPDEKVQQGSMVSLVVSAGPKGEGFPFRQSYVTIQLPVFKGEKEVTVLVADETTTNLVYDGMHSSGEKIRLMVSGYGDSTVTVKLGDEVLSSGKL